MVGRQTTVPASKFYSGHPQHQRAAPRGTNEVNLQHHGVEMGRGEVISSAGVENMPCLRLSLCRAGQEATGPSRPVVLPGEHSVVLVQDL